MARERERRRRRRRWGATTRAVRGCSEARSLRVFVQAFACGAFHVYGELPSIPSFRLSFFVAQDCSHPAHSLALLETTQKHPSTGSSLLSFVGIIYRSAEAAAACATTISTMVTVGLLHIMRGSLPFSECLRFEDFACRAGEEAIWGGLVGSDRQWVETMLRATQ